jgi:hypothetical protein
MTLLKSRKCMKMIEKIGMGSRGKKKKELKLKTKMGN